MRGFCYATVVVLLLAGQVSAGEEAIWSIGQKDHSYVEFAPTNDTGKYQPMFGDGVTFTIGKSDPAKDFSAIQPGPIDWWAGHRKATVDILFDLDGRPEGLYILRIDAVDTHRDRPARIQVDVNGTMAEQQLDHGVGDVSLSRPGLGKPQTLEYLIEAALLKPKGNRITIRNVAGSWMLYDAVTLVRRDGLPDIEVAANATIFYVERDGELLQELFVEAHGLASSTEDVRVDAYRGVERLGEFSLGKAGLGSVGGAIHIPGAARPQQLTLTVVCGDQTATTSLTQQPTKKWRIYCAPSTHTDIGYTDVQPAVIRLHNRNTDLALELVDDYPLYHWNLESSWAAQMWFRDRPWFRHKELYKAAQDSRIGIESTYLNMLTGLCSTEELIRNLYYSARLAREHGVPFRSHTLTDAPSHVWTVPTILANSGIKYLSCGVNQTRAPLFRKDIHRKSPFWWEGPDGSRVLTWLAAGYSQAGHIGLKDGADQMRTAIENELYRYRQRNEYPYDAILLHGAYSDNVNIGRSMAESITEYSKRYAYPEVILCSNDAFFSYIEENFPDKIPVVRGGGGSWWEDGAGSSARETGVNRVTHENVIAAEAIWAFNDVTGDLNRFPQDQFNRVWDNILLYDEHTWGAYNSISDPTSDFVQRQWAIKASYSAIAEDQTKRLIDRGLLQLAARIDAESGSVVVFNPTGRPRTGVVHVDIPRGAVVMGEDGPLPQQITAQDPALARVTVGFHATDVPAIGYRTYPVADSTEIPGPAGARFADNVFENAYYKVTFDPQTGAISSIIDKGLNTELVDAGSDYRLGQCVYAAGGGEDGRTQVMCPNLEKVTFTASTAKEIKPAASGTLFSSVKSSFGLNRFRELEMETILYNNEKRIDFVFRMLKDMTYDKEAVYIAFPFAGANPQFRYEIGAGSVRPNEDHFPGACRDWFAVQRWVTVNTDDAAVAWSAADTPLITLCDMTPGKWLETLPITNGTVFAYIMNNYWFTNYKAGQDGWTTFRYSITSDKSIDPKSACAFGERVQSPMCAVAVPPVRGKKTLPPSMSGVQVDLDGVEVTTVKKADDGRGIIVRLRETAGRDVAAKLNIGLPGITSAQRCDLVERDLGPLRIESGKTSINLTANGLATVRLLTE